MAGHPGAPQRVDDRYELRETIGRGGFGVVWRAHDTLLQRDVAVKEIRFPGVLDDSERAQVRDRVLREARAAARLNHTGAVTVYDVVDDDGQPFIVMELVDAPTLAEMVERDGPLTPERMACIALELLDTLSAAHALGIVHRDVKPANVMVAESGRVRLADFGIAAILDDPKVTTSGSITGSPSYMAPEQVNNQGTGPATDLWSLGATMYFGVEGEPPFSKGAVIPTLTSIATDAPRPAQRAGALGPVLDALLVKDPAGRVDADTLRRRLTELAERPVVADAPPAAAAVSASHPDDTVVLDAPLTAPAAATAAATAAAPAPSGPAARPAPDPAPEPPPVRRSAPAPAPPDRRGPIAAVAAVCALAVVGLVAWGMSSREPETTTVSPATEEQPATTPAPSSTAPASTARPATTRREAPPTTAATAARPATVPANWVSYTDPDTGFSISHPPGWTVVRSRGTITDFRDPSSGAYLRVDHVQPPGPDPVADWIQLERTFSAENANYRRIQITPATYAGFKAALWEFTYTGQGVDLHAVDLGFIAGRYGFALNFQTRAEDWQRMQPTFEAFKAAFKAPPD